MDDIQWIMFTEYYPQSNFFYADEWQSNRLQFAIKCKRGFSSEECLVDSTYLCCIKMIVELTKRWRSFFADILFVFNFIFRKRTFLKKEMFV